jgi:hypothetical protein
MNIVNKPVQVVSALDRAGIIKPVCIFIVDGPEQGEAITVNRLIRRDKEKIQGSQVMTFTCEINEKNRKKLCDLRFNMDTEEWILYRI